MCSAAGVHIRLCVQASEAPLTQGKTFNLADSTDTGCLAQIIINTAAHPSLAIHGQLLTPKRSVIVRVSTVEQWNTSFVISVTVFSKRDADRRRQLLRVRFSRLPGTAAYHSFQHAISGDEFLTPIIMPNQETSMKDISLPFMTWISQEHSLFESDVREERSSTGKLCLEPSELDFTLRCAADRWNPHIGN